MKIFIFQRRQSHFGGRHAPTPQGVLSSGIGEMASWKVDLRAQSGQTYGKSRIFSNPARDLSRAFIGRLASMMGEISMTQDRKLEVTRPWKKYGLPNQIL